MAAAVGTGASAGSNGATGALVMATWPHLEVLAGSPEQGDRNSHNGSTCCWPGDTPLHNVPSDCKQCIGRELAAGLAAAVAAGDAAEESNSCSDLW